MRRLGGDRKTPDGNTDAGPTARLDEPRRGGRSAEWRIAGEHATSCFTKSKLIVTGTSWRGTQLGQLSWSLLPTISGVAILCLV